jgi:CHAT domain-containing protein
MGKEVLLRLLGGLGCAALLLSAHAAAAQTTDSRLRPPVGDEARIEAELPALLALKEALDAGRHHEADTLIETLLPRYEREFGPAHAITLTVVNNLGLLRRAQGRLDEAEPLLLRALQERSRTMGASSQFALQSAHSLAALYQRQGRLDDAEQLALSTLAALEQEGKASDIWAISARNLLGELAFARNSPAEAVSFFTKAEELAVATFPDSPLVFEAQDGLSSAFSALGRLAEAQAVAERGLAGREQVLGRDHPATLLSINNLANIYVAQERFDRAEPLYVRSLARSTAQLGPHHPDTMASAENLASLRLRRDPNGGEALAPALQMVEALRARRNGLTATIFGEAQRRREWSRPDNSRRFALFIDAIVAATKAGTLSEADAYGDVFYALQEALTGSAQVAIARSAARRYASAADRALPALLDERDRLAERWRASGDQLVEFATSAGAGAAERLQQGRDDQAEVEARLSAIDDRLRREFPDYFQLIRPEPLQGPAAQQLLGPEDALLLVVPYDRGTHIFAFGDDEARFARSDQGTEQIAGLVARLRWEAGAQSNISEEQEREWTYARPSSGAMSFHRETAFELYEQIVRPVAQTLVGKRRLFIVTAGPLAALPFSLLVSEAPQGSDDDPAALRATRWLGNDMALVHVPSVRALSQLMNKGDRPSGGSFIGFGDPVLDGAGTDRRSRGAARLPTAEEIFTPAASPSAKMLADVAALRRLDRLPGTGRELATIGSIFGAQHTRLYTAEAATERAVYGARLREAAVIAFATHGLTPADAVPTGASTVHASEVFQLAEPGLVLTPPAEASEDDDGFLTASEVATLDLNADWVILSACNTATGDADSEGLSQLARAFFFAGARNLLASHWPVDDDVAARLTSRTLVLQRSGLTRAEAFRRAMGEIRNNPGNDAKASWAHPFFWAPFVLVGEGS